MKLQLIGAATGHKAGSSRTIADGEKQSEHIVANLGDVNRLGQCYGNDDALAQPVVAITARARLHLGRAVGGRTLRIHRLPRVWQYHRKSAPGSPAIGIYDACTNQRAWANSDAVYVAVAGLDNVAEAQRVRTASFYESSVARVESGSLTGYLGATDIEDKA